MSINAERRARFDDIYESAAFQGQRLDAKRLASKDGDLHAIAIAVSALEVLRGEALQGRKIGVDAILAVIDGLCAGAEVRQVADRRGGTFTIERI